MKTIQQHLFLFRKAILSKSSGNIFKSSSLQCFLAVFLLVSNFKEVRYSHLLGLLSFLLLAPALLPVFAVTQTEVANLVTEDDGSLSSKIAISEDTAVIKGSFVNDSGIYTPTVYVFVKDESGIWSQQAKLLTNEGNLNSGFDTGLDISGDTVIVYGPSDNSIYVFVRDEFGDWRQQAKLLADDGDLGSDVAISGNTVVVNGSTNNSVYVFQRDEFGGWHQQAKLLEDEGIFTYLVDISGNTLIVGTSFFDEVVYVFSRDGSGNWSQQAKLQLDDDPFYSVTSIGISGDTVVVGAPFDNGIDQSSGAAYVFVRDQSGLWQQQTKLLPDDVKACDQFGISVGISDDTIVISRETFLLRGCKFNDRLRRVERGVAYVFSRDEYGRWVQQSKLLQSDGKVGESFGSNVSISDNTALVSSRDINSSYVFDLNQKQSKPAFFDRRNFEGSEILLDEGKYKLPQLRAAGIDNDSISSIKVPIGYTVIAYIHGFSGPFITLTADTPDLKSLNFDNVISSIKIIKDRVDRPAFYEDADFAGPEVFLDEGQFKLTQLLAAGIENDSISSIRIPDEYTVRVYEHGFDGPFILLANDTSDLSSLGYDNAISSIEIIKDRVVRPLFYEQVYFSGFRTFLDEGLYTVSQLADVGVVNDSISSIKVPPGYTVFAYRHGFKEPFITLTTDSPELNSLKFDNVISSIEIIKDAVDRPAFYDGVDYTGNEVLLDKGQYNLSQLMAAGIENDAISSIRVPPGYWVTVNEHDTPINGSSITLTNDIPNLQSRNFDNIISSIKIQ
ncbi:MAG: beta/gamma crystallin-related protein [Methylococcaceae bacterium]